MKTINDLAFAQAGDQTLLLNLHFPADAPPGSGFPVIVWVHGGGWRGGDRKTPPLLALERGYVLAAIEYRLTPRATWPAQLDDCRNAVRLVREHARQYNLDPERIGAWGKSAGGHLVALLALQSGLPANRQAPWRIRAGCDYCGPSDLELFAEPKWRGRFALLHEVICDLLGGPIEERRELARDASPVRFAHAQCAPLRIVHGDLDDVVPVEEAETLYRALKAVGAATELDVARGVGHNCSTVETDAQTMKFFERTLHLPA